MNYKVIAYKVERYNLATGEKCIVFNSATEFECIDYCRNNPLSISSPFQYFIIPIYENRYDVVQLSLFN